MLSISKRQYLRIFSAKKSYFYGVLGSFKPYYTYFCPVFKKSRHTILYLTLIAQNQLNMQQNIGILGSTPHFHPLDVYNVESFQSRWIFLIIRGLLWTFLHVFLLFLCIFKRVLHVFSAFSLEIEEKLDNFSD